MTSVPGIEFSVSQERRKEVLYKRPSKSNVGVMAVIILGPADVPEFEQISNAGWTRWLEFCSSRRCPSQSYPLQLRPHN